MVDLSDLVVAPIPRLRAARNGDPAPVSCGAMTEVLESTAPASAIGLKTEEARRRLAEVGPNTTPDAEVHPLRRLLGKFIAPVPCLLEAAIVLQLILGEYIEASVIGLSTPE
jgi:magnesium-transporting ATPase (P-type)